MKIKTYGKIALILSILTILIIVLGAFDGKSPSEEKPAMIGIGNANTLKAAYERWSANYKQNGLDHKLVLPLKYLKGLSSEFTKSYGQATIDLIDGLLSVKVAGLSAEEALDVWLIDNHTGPGHSVKPETGDVMLHVGNLNTRTALQGFRPT